MLGITLPKKLSTEFPELKKGVPVIVEYDSVGKRITATFVKDAEPTPEQTTQEVKQEVKEVKQEVKE